jgi:hypothetical protein
LDADGKIGGRLVETLIFSTLSEAVVPADPSEREQYSAGLVNLLQRCDLGLSRYLVLVSDE